LKKAGAAILTRNFRCRGGEIDIIARLDGYLLFVEVRLRSRFAYSGAAESVDYHKQKKLIRAARFYLASNPNWSKLPCRFDVIAFEPGQPGSEAHPRWIRGAFTL